MNSVKIFKALIMVALICPKLNAMDYFERAYDKLSSLSSEKHNPQGAVLGLIEKGELTGKDVERIKKLMLPPHDSVTTFNLTTLQVLERSINKKQWDWEEESIKYPRRNSKRMATASMGLVSAGLLLKAARESMRICDSKSLKEILPKLNLYRMLPGFPNAYGHFIDNDFLTATATAVFLGLGIYTGVKSWQSFRKAYNYKELTEEQKNNFAQLQAHVASRRQTKQTPPPAYSGLTGSMAGSQFPPAYQGGTGAVIYSTSPASSSVS